MTAQTARGQSKAESYGNGVRTRRHYDELGRLTDIDTIRRGAKIQDNTYAWRSDGSLQRRTARAGSGVRRERFAYDYLNRLTGATTHLGDSSTASRTLTFRYDLHGNLEFKTGDVTGYDYDPDLGTNRLKEATIGDVVREFPHDTSGHIERYACKDPDDTDQNDPCAGVDDTFIGWNARGLAEKVTVGDSKTDATPTARDSFRYGPDGARYFKKSEWAVTSGATTTMKTSRKYYAGAYEKTATVGGDTVERVRIGDSVVHVKTTPAGMMPTAESVFEYVHRDHLGSVEAVTDEDGAELVVLGHDPYGERRKPDWTGQLTKAEIEALLSAHGERVSRGFTRHEHLDRTGLIHMNGRMYDPRLGRFLSPDPIVGDPTSSQSWNLYSYVGNNPLSYVDPTGLNPGDWGCGWLCQDDIDAWWDWLNFLNSWWDIPYAAGDSYDSAGDSHSSRDYASIRAAAEQTLRATDQSVADEPADSGEIIVKIGTPWISPPDTDAKPKKTSGNPYTPYKEVGVDRKARREILDVVKHPVFADLAKEIFDDSTRRDPKRETGALRVYERDGIYSVHSVGTPDPDVANRMKLDPVDEALGRHVVDWHPHPRGNERPSPADLRTSYRGGVPGVIKYGSRPGSRTVYQGGCKWRATCN